MSLLELIVVLAILGILAEVATLALRRIPAPPADDPATALLALRRQALREARQVTGAIVVNGARHELTVFADGSVAADSGAHVHRFSGTLAHAAR